MRFFLAFVVVLAFAFTGFAQTTPPTSTNVFSGTTINFNLSPVSLPGVGTTLSGAETDTLFAFSTNNLAGPTTLISSTPFIGGRYNRVIPQIADFLQNHTNLNGYNFQAGVTASLGVVKGTSSSHYGERFGVFLNYAPAGSQTFNIAVDLEANNLPGITHWSPSVAFGPNFRF